MAADVVELDSATTTEGSTVKIDASNGVKVNDATVVTPDVKADNGVIHIIDTVLIPQQALGTGLSDCFRLVLSIACQ